jgi:leader peptidase (prepilin peptidase)/N-methyltransferase
VPEAILAGIFGLLIGSFLNVCIYRWPRDLSVVKPRSFCPGCSAPIAWYDNIPVLSYLWLRGKCHHCSAPISWRYPVVEALTGITFFAIAATYGFTVEALRDATFVAILLALIFSDLETRLLPDELTIGGLLIGLTFAWITPVPAGLARWLVNLCGLSMPAPAISFCEALLGALIPSGALWLTGVLYQKVRGQEGLGFGDVKMLAAMGAFLGLSGTLFALLSGSLVGSVGGLAFIRMAHKQASQYELPFGLFLGFGGLLAITLGSPLLHWYAGLF